MKKAILIVAILLASASSAFAGPWSWTSPVSVNNVNIEQAQSGPSVCMVSTPYGVYAFFMNTDSASQMHALVSQALVSGKKIQMFYAYQTTITFTDLSGNNYALTKIAGITLNAN